MVADLVKDKLDCAVFFVVAWAGSSIVGALSSTFGHIDDLVSVFLVAALSAFLLLSLLFLFLLSLFGLFLGLDQLVQLLLGPNGYENHGHHSKH